MLLQPLQPLTTKHSYSHTHLQHPALRIQDEVKRKEVVEGCRLHAIAAGGGITCQCLSCMAVVRERHSVMIVLRGHCCGHLEHLRQQGPAAMEAAKRVP